MEDLFLGEPLQYWVEIQKGLDKKGTRELICEIATLRAKVSYYEKRINDMAKFMSVELEVKP